MNITDKQGDYVGEVESRLKKSGVRVMSDRRNEKVGFKIREHTLQAVPYMLVIGDREMENDQLAVRTQSGEDHGAMSVDSFVEHMQQQVVELH